MEEESLAGKKLDTVSVGKTAGTTAGYEEVSSFKKKGRPHKTVKLKDKEEQKIDKYYLKRLMENVDQTKNVVETIKTEQPSTEQPVEKKRVRTKLSHKNIIVSFTTLPNRIDLIPEVIDSMQKQTIVPDKVVLYISKDDFSSVPTKLLQIKNKYSFFEIRLINENYGVATKLLPALKDFHDDIIINIDDDIVYVPQFIENLMSSYNGNDDAVYCNCGHRLCVEADNNINKQKNCTTLYYHRGIDCSFLSGHGTLYPPHIFDTTNVMDYETMKQCCPSNDEIWAWANLAIKNIPVVVIGKYTRPLEWVQKRKQFDNALWLTNDKPEVQKRFFTKLTDYIRKHNPDVISQIKFSNNEQRKWVFGKNHRLIIITGATSNIQYQYNLTNIFKLLYCKKYGIDFSFHLYSCDKTSSYFQRQDLLKRYFNDYEYIMWMDTDAWFNDFSKNIFDLISKMEEQNKILLCTRDQFTMKQPKKYIESYVNSGVLIFKSCQKSLDLINAWQTPSKIVQDFFADYFKGGPRLYDQPYLCANLLFNDSYKDCALILDPNEFNTFTFMDPFNKSTFIYHAAGHNKLSLENGQWKLSKEAKKYFVDYIKQSSIICNVVSYTNYILKDDIYKDAGINKKIFDDRIFIPNGFELKPTLQKSPNYNKPFNEINWN